MIFNSFAFLVFFPTVVAAFFLTPPRLRWIVLLAASWIFYGWWKPSYLVLLVVSTLCDYTVGRLLGSEQRPRVRKLLLVTSLFVNLGMLFVYKYLGFFTTAVHAFAPAVPIANLVLPVGISFYTFQTIGYAIDVYRRKYEPETHLGRFAVFVSFFPHLVAGPIMRAPVLLGQFREVQRWRFERVANGLGWIAWGLFKKMVIADRAAQFVNAVYGDPTGYQGTTVVLATYLFAFQIYCDFSGYSDCAIGAARVLGIELTKNFDRPYSSSTIQEFWRRWHISLSTWFFDYVYMPLGGNRVGTARRVLNVTIVFMLSGLWHGANWTFVLWGAYHGALMIVTVALARALARLASRLTEYRIVWGLGRVLGILLTFHLVCFGWMLFRAKDLAEVGVLLSRLRVDIPISTFHELTHIEAAPAETLAFDLGILALSIVAMTVVERLVHAKEPPRVPAVARWLAFAALTAWLLVAAIQTHTPFLYFQF